MDYIYMNNAATTKVKPQVLKAMKPFLTDQNFGNPSSSDTYGRKAKVAVDEARRSIAKKIGCSPGELYFTSGSSESNSTVILGAALQEMRSRSDTPRRRLITTTIEHKSVIKSAHLVVASFDTYFAPVDHFGLVDLEKLDELIDDNTALVSISVCNNELGTVNDLEKIYSMILRRGDKRPLFHTDATQGLAHLPYDSIAPYCDAFSFAGHKLGGPKGIGGLYLNDFARSRIDPMIQGGNQENGMRAGTENVPGIIGLAAAMEAHTEADNQRVGELSDYLYDKLIDFEGCQLNSFMTYRRAPGIVNASFKGVDAEALLMTLELKGIIASAGSACNSHDNFPYVLYGVNIEEEFLHGTIRFSLGDDNTKEEVDYLLDVLRDVVPYLRNLTGGVA